MTSRNDMDKPAMIVTAVLGIVLIAVSVPFTIKWWGEGTTEYEVAWEETPVGSPVMAQITETTKSDTKEVAVNDLLVSNVTVTMAGTCGDVRGTGDFNPAAQMTWTLSVRYANGTTEMLPDGTGTFTCNQANTNPISYSFEQNAKPDLGAREVEVGKDSEERDAARAGVWDPALVGSLNETSTYVLELSATRGASTFPLPVGGPAATLSVSLTLTVQHWDALLQEVGTQNEVR